MTLRAWLALLVALGACAMRPTKPPAPSAARPFIITFWCGPPLAEFTDARAAEIADAGFSVVGPPCEGGRDRGDQLRALDVAARHGLRMWVIDDRVGKTAPAKPGWEAAAAAVVADYGTHPALDGYFVTDEPSTKEFPAVAKVVDWLRQADAAHLAYVNLFPGYVRSRTLGTDSYEDYLEQFATTVRPQLLSYDYYPFLTDKDRHGFFRNLAAVRETAARHRIPFMYIAQAMPHGPYRDPTESELAWQVFNAMAYGARGISYFAYWTPPDEPASDLDARWNFRYGLVEHGTPTRHFFQVARLNRVIRVVTQQLEGFEFIAVVNDADESASSFPIGPIDGIEGGTLTVGLFGSPGGDLAALVVNRDYRYAATVAVRLSPGARAPERFDPVTGRWKRENEFTFRLEPGSPQLLKWRARS